MNHISEQRKNECIEHQHVGETIIDLGLGIKVGELLCKVCGAKVQCPSKTHGHD